MIFALERMRDVKTEIEAIQQAHWDEIGEEGIELDPDWDTYFASEDAGMVHCLTARCEGLLVGYHISFVRPFIHSRKVLGAYVDAYFLHPEYRKGTNGLRLLAEAEKSLVGRGVKAIFSSTTKRKDNGRLLEHLGYRHSEDIYSKVIA